MTQLSGSFAQLTVAHVLALLQADLPAAIRSHTLMGEYLPGLLSQLPFISVTATAKATRAAGLGGTVAIKREVIDGGLVDLGYVTGTNGECEFTLTLWAVTRPQLEEVRTALEALTWVQRPLERAALANVLNRTTLLRCRLANVTATIVAPLPPAPPSVTITANNTNLRAAPAADAAIVGQASANQQFELLGRSADSAFLQGCCFNGQAIWVAATEATTPIPVATIPVVTPPPAAPLAPADVAPVADPVLANAAEIDPGTAIVATATTPVITAWRQDLHYVAHLEVTQEPITGAGELIQELQITRQLGANGQIFDTERTRLLADEEVIVDSFS